MTTNNKKGIMKPRRILAKLLVFLPWLPRFALANRKTTLPKDLKFDVSKGDATLTQEFELTQHRNYYFTLKFHYIDGVNSRQLEKLVGDGATYADGSHARPGIIVPVHLRIDKFDSTTNSKLIYEKVVETKAHFARSFGEGSDGYYKRMISDVELKPGRYKLQISTIRSTPEFEKVDVYLAITYHPNTAPLTE